MNAPRTEEWKSSTDAARRPQTKPDGLRPLIPEPVQIILAVPDGQLGQADREGVRSNTVYEPILSAEQLAQLNASPAQEPYDCDAGKFRLGVEAMRLGLACEYDPYFSLSMARVD